jgi:hypothetical protein
MAHIVWNRHKESMSMSLAAGFSLRLLAHKAGTDTLVLDENKDPFLPYKSDHVRCFWVHLVYMAY